VILPAYLDITQSMIISKNGETPDEIWKIVKKNITR
jgi:hypothetical protein